VHGRFCTCKTPIIHTIAHKRMMSTSLGEKGERKPNGCRFRILFGGIPSWSPQKKIINPATESASLAEDLNFVMNFASHTISIKNGENIMGEILITDSGKPKPGVGQMRNCKKKLIKLQAKK